MLNVRCHLLQQCDQCLFMKTFMLSTHSANLSSSRALYKHDRSISPGSCMQIPTHSIVTWGQTVALANIPFIYIIAQREDPFIFSLNIKGLLSFTYPVKCTFMFHVFLIPATFYIVGYTEPKQRHIKKV